MIGGDLYANADAVEHKENWKINFVVIVCEDQLCVGVSVECFDDDTLVYY